MISVQEIECKSALHRLKRRIPYGWDLNLYHGCQHGCIYCYAQDLWPYRGKDTFNHEIAVKSNIAEVLENELKAASWKKEIINIGGVTDSYQPLEEKYQLMRKVLQLCIRYETPVIISTKSDLILRDIDLIAELAEITYVNVACTVTTVDEKIRTIIEPGAVSAERRFAVLKEFSRTKACRGVHVMPIIPFLTDHDENLSEIFEQSEKNEVCYALCGTLYLRGAVKSLFFKRLKEAFPDQTRQAVSLYVKGSAPAEYKQELYRRVNHWRARHNITGEYSRYIRERLKSP